MRRQAAEPRDQPLDIGGAHREAAVVHCEAQAFPQHRGVRLPGWRVAETASFGVEGVDQRSGIGRLLAVAGEDLAERRLDAFVPLHKGAVEVEGDGEGGHVLS
jgi:hypothetical protein